MENFIHRQGIAIRAVCGEGVEHVGDRQGTHLHREAVGGEAAMIPFAVQPLMVRGCDLCQALEAADLFQYLLTVVGVAADASPFLVGRFAVFIQNGIGDGQLTYIVQQGRSPQCRAPLAGDPQAVGDFERISADTGRVLSGKL